ncbi:unnamed protein product [Tuber aestivum]|uniref:F-box domain-containing protein n=1 Tax=Tuber aestivum TaxID=59557 RepID=A0A292PJL0_9PEZI|nr:unnamed protein product [Tuber aestivum]
MNLLDIPSELLLLIGEELSAKDLTAFTKTSRAVHSLLTPRLYYLGAQPSQTNEFPPLYWAAQYGHLPLLHGLLSKGAKPVGSQYKCELPGCTGRHISTALHWATKSNNETVIKILLARGVSVNAIDNHNSTPVHWACGNSTIPILKLLVDQDADLSARDGDGDPPIAWAAEKGIPDTFEYMLSRGADIRATNSSGATLLHTIFLRGNKYLDKHAEVVRIMLNRDFDMLAHTDNHGDAALHLAARWGSLEAIKLMLDENLAQRLDVNMRGSDNATPLYQASENGALEMVEYLISKGADVNVPNSSESTPLHTAAFSGRLEIVRALVDAGADVNAIRGPFTTVLYEAVIAKHLQVADLLLERGADVNGYLPPTTLKTHLHIAAGHPETAAGHPEMLRVLLRHGANIDAKDSTGSTALMYAASCWEDPQMCEILLEHGADVRARDNEGRKAWNRAHESGMNATKKILEKYMDIWPAKSGNGADDMEEEFIGSPTESWELENFFVVQEVDAQLAAAAQAQEEAAMQDAVEGAENANSQVQNEAETEDEDVDL